MALVDRGLMLGTIPIFNRVKNIFRVVEKSE